MTKLHEDLQQVNGVRSSTFIDTATFPVIKLEYDLQVQRKKHMPKINDELRYLKVDITFDLNDGENPHLGLQCS